MLTEKPEETPERLAFYKKIDRLAYTPLWTVFADIITLQPQSNCEPNLWKFDQAREWLLKAVERNPDIPEFHVVLAATLGHLGETDRARQSLEACKRLRPSYLKDSSSWLWYKHEANNEHFLDGLRKAGWES